MKSIALNSGTRVCSFRRDATGNLVLSKSIDVNKHLLRSPRGFAHNVEVVASATNSGVKHHVLTERQTGEIWRVEHTVFLQHCEPLNRGFGDQLLLRLEFWQYSPAIKSQTVCLELFPPSQLQLFGDDMELAA